MNKFLDQNQSYLSEKIIQVLINFTLGTLVIWTVLSHLLMIFGLSFATLCIIFSISFVIYVIVFSRRFSLSEDFLLKDYSTISVLAFLCLLGGVISLVSLRYDADDVNFLSKAVFYLENPSAPLSLRVYDHALLPFNLETPFQITQIIEFFYAYLATLLRVSVLDVYHFIVPFVAGGAIPLVWYILVSKFTQSSKAALIGVIAILAYLCLDGSSHRIYGNFAFVRIWQGKSIVMSILIPLFTVYSIEFFKSPNVRKWANLAMLSTLCSSLTSSSVFLVPALSLCLGSAYLASGVDNLKYKVQHIFLYFSSLFYLIAVGLFLFFATNGTKFSTTYGSGLQDFKGHFMLMFTSWYSYSFLVVILSSLVAVIFIKSEARRFLLGWITASILFFLNPVICPIVMKNLTTTQVYWRLFYILPFPLVIGISAAIFWQIKKPRFAFAVLFLSSIFALIFLIPDAKQTLKNIPFGFSMYKLPPDDLDDAENILKKAEPGSMFAPQRYSRLIPLLSSKYPQVRIRGLGHIIGSQVSLYGFNEGFSRKKATRVLEGVENNITEQEYQSFLDIIELDLQTVVLHNSRSNNIKLKKLLNENGYEIREQTDRYILYSRININTSKKRGLSYCSPPLAVVRMQS